MIAAPADRRTRYRRLAAASVAAGIWLACPAAAQDPVGQPLQLLPPAETGSERPGGRRTDVIVIDDLPPQDAAGAGTLGPGDGGFGASAWRGARRAEVAGLLEGLPVAAPSQVMGDLTRRLLLTAARPPEGAPVDPSLAALRARRLLDLGRADDLQALFRAGPALSGDEPAARALVESLLLDGRAPEACEALQPLLRLHQGPFWQRALVFCQAAGEDRPAARLGLGLLREGTAADPMFVALTESMIESLPPSMPEDGWPSNADPEPLMIAAFAAVGLAIPGVDLIRDPGRLAAVAGNAANGAETRLLAGEKATAAGVMTPTELATLYAEIPLEERPVSELMDMVLDMDGPMARAYLVQAANAAGGDGGAYRFYETALGISRAEGAPLAVTLALLDRLPADEPSAAIAPDAARAYYAAGDLERAWAWHEVAVAAGGSADDRAALTRLWPLAVLSGALDARPAGQARLAYARSLSEWIAVEVALSGEAGTYSAAMALAAFSALGEPVDPAVWQRIGIDDARESASLPSAGIWWRLPAAARDGEVGMVVLMSLVAIGEGGPARISPALLERVLSAMVAVGLEDDARRLAREAIWATQL